MLKAVLFDLDDTLFDHRHSSRTALSVLQQKYSHELGGVPLDELEEVSLDILNSIHHRVLNGDLTQEQARPIRFRMLLERYGISRSEKELGEIAALYRAEYQESRRATPGVKNLLCSLRERGIKTAIVSNNLVDEQMDKLQHCELLDLLDSITVSEETGCAKPAPRIFQIALDRLECSPQDAIMIGDSWENDILGAREAGIAGIWYNCYSAELPDKNVPEIRSFNDSDAVIRLLFPE